MEIDRILYNISLRTTPEDSHQYIRGLNQQQLQPIRQEIIDRVNEFNPDDQDTISQIRTALQLCEKLMENETFYKMSFPDESFICSLAFYIGHDKQNIHLVSCLKFIEHQLFGLNQKSYVQVINLFKSLGEIYQFISEQYYERVVELMLYMLLNNMKLVAFVHHPYYFLECLIQVVNKQHDEKKMEKLLSSVRTLYSVQDVFLFHEKDMKVLIDVLIRTLIDSQNCTNNDNTEQMVEQTLKVYLVLKQNEVLAKQKYKVPEMHQAIREKFSYYDVSKINPSLKKLIDETLSCQ